jgi:hypothetical protein
MSGSSRIIYTKRPNSFLKNGTKENCIATRQKLGMQETLTEKARQQSWVEVQ